MWSWWGPRCQASAPGCGPAPCTSACCAACRARCSSPRRQPVRPRRGRAACWPARQPCRASRGRRRLTGGRDVMPTLFPIGEYWWLYAAFTGTVLGLLALDLGVFHRESHEVGLREAVLWCAAWVSMAVLFNIALYAYASWRFPRDPRLTALPAFDPESAAWLVALEFFTGYLVEYSLSVDNIFVFVLVLGYFGVPAR